MGMDAKSDLIRERGNARPKIRAAKYQKRSASLRAKDRDDSGVNECNAALSSRSTSPQYVSIDEFARRHAWSAITIRRRIKEGKLRAIQPGGPRTSWRIPLDAVAEASVSSQRDSTPTSSSPSAASDPSRPSPEPRPTHTPHWMRKSNL
jgi:excisionase family DNA binding protein